MGKFFYAKLAGTNIYKNRKMYIPFILTCIGTIAMYYIMHFISNNPGINEIPGGSSLLYILFLGTFVIGLFAVIFLFYTNSFLIKQRKKEFGLYNVLGLEKKHLARVILWETIYITLISLIIGILTGILFSKFMFLFLNKLLHFYVPITYMISGTSILATIILFLIIAILTLLNNIRQIYKAEPIELLKAGQMGEREPKTKWLLSLFGLITLGTGYYIALTTESPIGAINKFFLAVILVIIGTYALFTAGTIALLKLLRKNKTFYYKTNHFINVSGMIYRMKRNAVSLANICILSTMVLVTVSSTVSLYIGMEELLETRYPKDMVVKADEVSAEKIGQIEQLINEQTKKHHLEINDIIQYRYVYIPTLQKGNEFEILNPQFQYFTNLTLVTLIPLYDYEQLVNVTESLESDEVLIWTFRGNAVEEQLTIAGKTFDIKKQVKDLPIDGETNVLMADHHFVIVKDEQVIQELFQLIKELFPNEERMTERKDLSLYYSFDTVGNSEDEITFTHKLNQVLKEAGIRAQVEGREEARDFFYSVYGGLFFIGIFLGSLFLMATVLIIYYKQISEGYEDKERFGIMRKVGLSKEEIKKTVRSQVLMVFFLPLVTAVIHIGFAFKVITKLLALLNLTNVGLFALCTVGTILVFAFFYTLVYILTAREYYKIVSTDEVFA